MTSRGAARARRSCLQSGTLTDQIGEGGFSEEITTVLGEGDLIVTESRGHEVTTFASGDSDVSELSSVPDVESVGSSVLHEVANTPSSRAEATAIGARWILWRISYLLFQCPGGQWWVMVQVRLGWTERGDDDPGTFLVEGRAVGVTGEMQIGRIVRGVDA